MSDWLIHRDSSSVEYDAGSPNETSLKKSCSHVFCVCSRQILTAALCYEGRLDLFSVFTGLRASLPRRLVEKENREK